MSKSYRIRTTPGLDQNIRINLNQKYETLDILSLKIRQTDLYGTNCADYGVVVGRVFSNGGYGIPNARVSLFVPIEDIDEDNEVISNLYPYKSISTKDENGYRYNLLPKRQQHSGHTPTGTFPSKQEVLTDNNVLEVFEKYYKFTAKTNNAGDFMITGVPVGTYIIHYDVDISDIGCQSLVPFDLRYEGVSEEEFENPFTFKASDNLDSLPQIISTQKTVNVEPLWGDEDLCELGITRSDFDLATQGFRIEPYALFMGGTYTDDGRNGVKVRCNVDNEMGEKCSLITTEGDIEAIRFTGQYETNEDGSVNDRRPILEGVNLDASIDENGNFFVRVPMNLKYVTTDEFGYLIETKDPKVGIPTEGKYRFRFSLNDSSGGRRTYRAKFLVPQVKEHQVDDNGNPDSVDPKSYSFSVNIDDYPDDAIDDIIGTTNPNQYPNDYFYGFRYNRVYTVSGFINQYYNKGVLESAFGFFARNRNESFIGIKEIQPESNEDCSNNNEYFPITDATNNTAPKFIIIVLLNLLENVYLRVTQFVLDTLVEAFFDFADFFRGFPPFPRKWRINSARFFSNIARRMQKAGFRKIGLINYPDCVDCNGSFSNVDAEDTTFNFEITDEIAEKIKDGKTPRRTDYLILDMSTVPFFREYTASERNAVILRDNQPHNGGDELDENGTFLFEYTINGNKKYLLVGNGTTYPIVNQDLISEFNSTSDGKRYTQDNQEVNEYWISDKIIYGLVDKIQQEYIDEYGLNGNYFDDLVSSGVTEVNTVINNTNSLSGGEMYNPGSTIIIDAVYETDPSIIVYSPEYSNTNELVETACDKYDVIYNPTDSMRLRAYVVDNGNESYNDLIQNPDGYPQNTPYPDPFQELGDDPCNKGDRSNIIVSISQYVDENTDWESERGRRLAFKKHGTGTASGYSEFRNGVYSLVPAAGKNQALIGNYIRRKRLGQVLCAGYISYSFVNSWLNGSLYFFQFRRRNNRTGLFTDNRRTNFCKDLIYRKVENNETHYYYRSTPYFNNKFVGLKRSFTSILEGGGNYTEILYPTTVMDLGPRNNFLSEICTEPSLDVNCSVVRSIGSTSYQDINNLMTYILQSKEIKEMGRLDAPDLFNVRSGNAIDGDIAQLLNFNSQTGIWGYEDDYEESPYYPENGEFSYDGIGPVGVDFVFSEDDPDTPIVEKNGAFIRFCINSPNQLSETSQTVPYYRWDKVGPGFGDTNDPRYGVDSSGISYNGGSEKQTWIKSTIYETKLQGGWVYDNMLNTVNDTNLNEEYVESYLLPPIRDCVGPIDSTVNVPQGNYRPNSNGDYHIPIGGPFLYYFGLRTGKNAFDKFVKNFGYI